jgi:hypothetical protein
VPKLRVCSQVVGSFLLDMRILAMEPLCKCQDSWAVIDREGVQTDE